MAGKSMPPSEFGGRVDKRGIQPSPHVPTASEELSLRYRGLIGVDYVDDEGATWQGLEPYAVAYEKREREGAFRKGEEWERLQREGEQAQP